MVDFFLGQCRRLKVGRISAIELCQKLKSEAITKQDDSAINNLRLRILDYFITHNVPDDMFEKVLKARLNDPDPVKEQSKVICTEILEAWRNVLKQKEKVKKG
jgi:hypothetical protein